MQQSARNPHPDQESVYAAIELLQEKWILHIVRSLLEGPKGFNRLGREVGGCNPTTLTQRLQRLETCGLVVRASRRSYSLTASGAALVSVIEAIGGWAEAHLDS
jgi:DNA-binding HxlR family transcriptional regulator